MQPIQQRYAYEISGHRFRRNKNGTYWMVDGIGQAKNPTRVWTPAMMANNHRHKRFSDGAYRKKLGRYGDILGTSVSKFRVIQCASGRFLGGLGLIEAFAKSHR